MNESGKQMVFSCSWAVYFTACAGMNPGYPPQEWEAQCGVLPWKDHFISDICHMWRYGEDLTPTWTNPTLTPAGGSGVNGVGGSGVGDIIEFAAEFWAAVWREQTGPGAFNDPDFLVVGCPTDKPCEAGYTGGGPHNSSQIPLSYLEQQTQFSFWCLMAAPLIIGSGAFVPHLDLSRAPYGLYGVKYIDLVSLWWSCAK